MLRPSQIFWHCPPGAHAEIRGGLSVAECVSTKCLPSSAKVAVELPSSAETLCIPEPSSFTEKSFVSRGSPLLAAKKTSPNLSRSEERRVGKECRSRWS